MFKKRCGVLCFLSVVLLGVVFLLGMAFFKQSSIDAETVEDLADSKEYIYIKENGEYVPFLVLSNDYVNGSVLLLRQEILPEDHRMNRYSSYYNGSEIDKWLNEEYIESFGAVQSVIKETELTITKVDTPHG